MGLQTYTEEEVREAEALHDLAVLIGLGDQDLLDLLVHECVIDSDMEEKIELGLMKLGYA